ncbi:hypothetical protein BJV77DRAFT_962061 [Russula vinacea]|nr:hypothetical protein BJV77DRAFT_962061 [Russula vinacea]
MGLRVGHGIGEELGSVVAREGMVSEGVGFLEKTGQGKWEIRMNRGNSNLWDHDAGDEKSMKSDSEFLSEFPQQQAVNLRTSQSTFGAVYPFAPRPNTVVRCKENYQSNTDVTPSLTFTGTWSNIVQLGAICPSPPPPPPATSRPQRTMAWYKDSPKKTIKVVEMGETRFARLYASDEELK